MRLFNESILLILERSAALQFLALDAFCIIRIFVSTVALSNTPLPKSISLIGLY
jgi:hypothetical protein